MLHRYCLAPYLLESGDYIRILHSKSAYDPHFSGRLEITLKIWTKYNQNALVFEEVKIIALKIINSFIKLDGISTSQTWLVPPQQVTVEDGAQGANLLCLLSFPRAGKKSSLCSCSKGSLWPTYGQSNLPGVPHVFLGYRGGFTKHEEPCCTKRNALIWCNLSPAFSHLGLVTTYTMMRNRTQLWHLFLNSEFKECSSPFFILLVLQCGLRSRSWK